MNKNVSYLFLCILLSLFYKTGQSQSDFWQRNPSEKSQTYQLNEASFRQELTQALLEKDMGTLQDGILLDFPTPEGDYQSFRLFETPVFESVSDKDLLSFKTYTGIGKKNSLYRLKLEVTPFDISVFIIGEKGKAWFINPVGHQSYRLKKKGRDRTSYDCFSKALIHESVGAKSKLNFGGELYIYRLALSASGEYFQFWGNRDSTLAALVRTVNRMNAIFERDLAIRFQLIDDIKFIIFDNPLTDPFELNGNQNVQNQQFLDLNIGENEYDIGHVLMVDEIPNGFGSVGSVCVDGKKGRGYSVLPDPSDDDFIIDFLVHELGHQLGGNHTFSHCGSSSSGLLPVEPGSGSTIMAYGGLTLCDEDNFVEHASPYFHAASIEEIYNFTRQSEGNSCATQINFPNSAPSIELEAFFGTIPYRTPFELSAMVSDSEGDTLSYNWEQMDQTVQLPLGQIQEGSPLFRSRAPGFSSIQSFPSVETLITTGESPEERLPDFSGQLSFRLTARDNHFRGGGVSWKETKLNVTEQAGPFRLITAEEPEDWGLGNSHLVRWEVANTDKVPVSEGQVDVFFVYDTLDQEVVKIAGPVPNNGEAFVSVPANLNPGKGWLKVKGHNTPFFDLSDSPITLMLAVSDDQIELAQEGIHVFPNPAQDHIFIEKKEGEGIELAVVQWIDIYGKILAKKEVMLSKEPAKIKTPTGINNGWYFVRVLSKREYIEKVFIH